MVTRVQNVAPEARAFATSCYASVAREVLKVLVIAVYFAFSVVTIVSSGNGLVMLPLLYWALRQH